MNSTPAAVLAFLLALVPLGLAAEEAATESGVPAGSLSAFWQEQRASGVWRANYFRSSKNLDGATDFPGATFELKAFPSLTDKIDGKLEVRATNASVGEGAETRVRLLEGYATVHFAEADLHVGKQIVAWGRADGINPTDNLTPRDYTVMLPFENDQRFGTTAVKFDAFVSPEHTVTLFASPFFQPSQIPLPSAGQTVIENRPAHSLSNTSAGAKLNKVGEGFDWSVSYFRGFSLLPNVRRIDSPLNTPTLELDYGRISAFGADIARNYGRFGFRGEVVYVDTADDAGTDPQVKNGYLYWIAGVDRTFFENLNVNLQFFQRRVRNYTNPEHIPDAASRAIALENAILDGQRDAISNGISFRVSNQWLHETLEVELFAAVNFTRNDSFLRPLVTYAFSDRWKGTVGAEIYRGPSNTQYGSLKPNRGAFAELRYGF
jgi:hypothetical protein